jgi:hypothetical protein
MSWIGTTERQSDVEGTAFLLAPRVRSAFHLYLRRLAASRLGFVACVVLGLALLSPCISTPRVADDLLHELMLRPSSGIAGLPHQPLDLFRFATGDPDSARQLTDAGVFPWWADPQARLAFFRPLASLTHWLDYRLWPGSAAAMHLHSLLWFGTLLTVVGALYRRFFASRNAAHLALLLFALDDAHAPVASWIANRNLIIALCFSLPALLLHDRFRRQGSRQSGWLGPLALAFGLCAGEAGLIACAYLVAYAAFLDRGSFLERYGSLGRYAAVVLGWRLLLDWLDYGVTGSGLYVDPLTSPLTFVRVASERLPVLLLAQLALPWADFWELYPLVAPALRGPVFVWALVVLAIFAALLRPLWREKAEVRFWAIGGLLAFLPMCATFPHDRLLLGGGIGAMALISELLRRAFVNPARARKWALLSALGGIHLVLAPVVLPLRSAHVADLNHVLNSADRSLPSSPDVARKSMVLLNPPLDPFAAYLPAYREAAGRVRPKHLLWLATGVTELTVTGVDSSSFRVRARDGFMSSSSQLMLRDPRHPPRLGETRELGAASIRVLSIMPDGRPREILVRFRQPLASPEFLWMQWQGHGYVPFEPPAVGVSVVVPAVDVAAALFG